MFIIVLGLGALVFYLGRKAPAVTTSGSATSVGPNLNIPPTGADSVQSPASSGGSPLISQANKIRLNTTYQNAQTSPAKIVSSQVPFKQWKRKQRAFNPGADYLTDANSQLMTQNVPPLVTQSTGVAGTKL